MKEQILTPKIVPILGGDSIVSPKRKGQKIQVRVKKPSLVQTTTMVSPSEKPKGLVLVGSVNDSNNNLLDVLVAMASKLRSNDIIGKHSFYPTLTMRVVGDCI